MIINDFKLILEKEKKKRKECEFCNKKYVNLKCHQLSCRKNPEHRQAEQCPHCKKYYMKLESHVIRCRRSPDVIKRKKMGLSLEHSHVQTIWVSPDLLNGLSNNFQVRSAKVREAIRHKIERDADLKEISVPASFSVSMPKSMYFKMLNIVNKNWNLSVSDFIRDAIKEEVRNDDHK